MTSQQIRENVSRQLLEAIEGNVLPWRRPWSSSRSTGRHCNFESRRAYSGCNPLLLELHCLKHGFASNEWATFNQWKDIGCDVKKRPVHVPPGQWGCAVVLCKPCTRTVLNRNTGEEEEDTFWLLRTFTVFNRDQVTGEAVERSQEAVRPNPVTMNSYPAVEELIAATQAKIVHGGDRACYRLPLPEGSWPNHSDGDYVLLPERQRFHSTEAYLETALHELTHWGEVRIGWDRRRHGYSMGELVAEISACYVASELGMPITLENHAAYLRSWCDGMRDSPSFIFKACGMASKTADHLLSYVRPAEGDSGASEEAEAVAAA
jgi:antirestriction protein ArdC